MGRDHSSADEFDVVVVGGGVLGTAVAARLSTTTASTCLFEAADDVAEGASKGNAGVTTAYYGPPGTLETQLISASTPLWEGLCERLSVPYRRLGSILVALDDEQAGSLDGLRAEMQAAGVHSELLTALQARRHEPLITDRCVAALHLPADGVVDSVALTVAYASLAATNGVSIRLRHRVTAISERVGGWHRITSEQGEVRARFIVNAAGVAADNISQLAGGERFRCWPRKGQYAVLDRAFAHAMKRIVFGVPSSNTKGISVIPTVHGSALLGPTAEDHDDPTDTSTDLETLNGVLSGARALVPGITDDMVVKFFAANRPASDEPFRFRCDKHVPSLVHCTDRSAGLSLSPAAGDHVLGLLRANGLDRPDRPDAVQALPRAPRLLGHPNPAWLIEQDARFGQIVCGCEQVSAAEVCRALQGPMAAGSIAGVGKRCGALRGRCQGAQCVAEISAMTSLHRRNAAARLTVTEECGR